MRGIVLIIGLIVFLAGLYYFIKDKDDAESRKVYGVTAVIGLVIFVISLLTMGL